MLRPAKPRPRTRRVGDALFVTGVNVDETRVVALDAERLRISVSGSVDCTLQYGSSGDVARGDGLIAGDSYPFSCEMESPADAPRNVELDRSTFVVDTSSFYE